MAPQSAAASISALRAASYRISSTPTRHLPGVIPHITALLPTCKQLLASPQDAKVKESSHSAVAVHKFRTQLSTLLQDRTVEGRWAAVVLVKCTIELGGQEVLQRCAPWVRGLLNVLGRPDPPSARKLCMITLTKIFLLTRDHPTLLREITIPSLPTMIATCLKIFTAGSQSPSVQQTPAQRALLHTMLECFSQLLPRHPTIFRSYQSQLLQLLVQIIAPTPSGSPQDGHVIPPLACEAAQRLFVQLHCCAPKSTSTEEWDRSLKAVVTGVHNTADKVFRAVIEDWESVAGMPSRATTNQTLEQDVHETGPDAMGLPGWSGLFAGSERMTGQLRLLAQFICTPTAAAVGVKIGLIADLLTRLFSLAVPSSTDATIAEAGVRFNNQIGREEREDLWLALPQIHEAAIEVLEALVERFTDAVCPTLNGYLDQVVWIFKAENASDAVRASIYRVAIPLVSALGPSFTKSSVDALAQVIHLCCADLLDEPKATGVVRDQANGKRTGPHTTMDISLGTTAGPKPFVSLTRYSASAAYSLLPVLLARIPAQQVPVSLRTLIDRTAVLLRHKEAMLTSALNPPVKKGGKPASSVLRLLATSFPESLEVEGLLRPRMPVVRTGLSTTEEMLSNEDEVEDIEEEYLSPQPPATAMLPQNEASPEKRSASVMIMGGDLSVVPLGEEAVNDSTPQIQQTPFSDLPIPVQIPTATRSVKRNEPPTTDSPPLQKRTRREMSAQPPGTSQPMQGAATEAAILTLTPGVAGAPEFGTSNSNPVAGGGAETAYDATFSEGPPAGSTSQSIATYLAPDDDDEDDFEVPTLTIGQDTSEAEEDEEDN